MGRSLCLTSARFSMVCDIIKPSAAPESDPVPNTDGEWQYYQDPDSGAIINRWVDNPDTVDIDESRPGAVIKDIPLMARGVLSGGLTAAGTTEKFDEIYTNVDWVKAVFPKNVNITKRDRVTNIRTKRSGELVWREEEMDRYPATIFNVMGVTPSFDPFSNLIEYSVLLQRAEVQSG